MKVQLNHEGLSFVYQVFPVWDRHIGIEFSHTHPHTPSLPSLIAIKNDHERVYRKMYNM